jgi:hypothetical protein
LKRLQRNSQCMGKQVARTGQPMRSYVSWLMMAHLPPLILEGVKFAFVNRCNDLGEQAMPPWIKTSHLVPQQGEPTRMKIGARHIQMRMQRIEDRCGRSSYRPRAIFASVPIPQAAGSYSRETVDQWIKDGLASIAFNGRAVHYHGGRTQPMIAEEWTANSEKLC